VRRPGDAQPYVGKATQDKPLRRRMSQSVTAWVLQYFRGLGGRLDAVEDFDRCSA
jgi:hypothetical protein